MTALRAGRFPDRITRRRQMPGYRDAYGSYVEGTIEDVVFAASAQPLKLEDADAVGGAGLVERLKVYIPSSDALRAARDRLELDSNGAVIQVTASADVVFLGADMLNGYVVEESRSWPGHTRATLLREP